MKNKIIILIVLVLVVLGVVFLISDSEKNVPEGKEILNVEQDLDAVELTDEQKQALESEGVQLPSSDDEQSIRLQTVSSSDELDDIKADILETDISGLDTELEEIETDLSNIQ